MPAAHNPTAGSATVAMHVLDMATRAPISRAPGRVVVARPAAALRAALVPLADANAKIQRHALHNMAGPHGFATSDVTTKYPVTASLAKARQLATADGYITYSAPLASRSALRCVVLGRAIDHDGSPEAALGAWAGTDVWRLWVLRTAANDARWSTLLSLTAEHPDILELARIPLEPAEGWASGGGCEWIDELSAVAATAFTHR